MTAPPHDPSEAQSTDGISLPEVPGGLVRLAAVLSEDERHRFTLVRSWDPQLPRMLWIGLNPATADYREMDASSKAVTRFAAGNGYGRVDVGNLFSVRQVDPAKVRGRDLIRDPETDRHLQGMIDAADTIVVGWGTSLVPGKEQRVAQVIRMCAGRDLFCFGAPLKYGQPTHAAARRGHLKPLQLWLRA